MVESVQGKQTVRNSPKGPFAQRIGVTVFTVLFGMLVFWLLSFVVCDIGNIRGPRQSEVDKTVLDATLVAQLDRVHRAIAANEALIGSLRARQAILRDSTNSSQQTMNQLLDMEKQNLRGHVQPAAAEQQALAEGEALFIANQAQYQGLNEEMAKKSEEQRKLEDSRRALDARLAGQREQAVRKFQALDRRHRLRVAGLQLLFLIPILAAALYCVLRWRGTLYAPLIHAFGIATLAKVIIVVHENFPTRYIKYVLLIASLLAVVRILIYLIASAARPKMAYLLKQYREAYERFLCPVCEYPIRRGPMRYAFWNRRSIRHEFPVTQPVTAPEEPYACPSCGSRLFEVCPSCASVRTALLPFCDHCGDEKSLV